MGKGRDPELLYNKFTSTNGLGLSNNSGVYAIGLFNPISKHKRIVYIGSSKNMARRVYSNNHVYMKLHTRSDYLVFALEYECDNYVSEEAKIISEFKPFLNKYGKNS